MKKVVALLLSCVLAIGLLAGCFEFDNNPTTTNGQTPSTTTTVGKVTYQPIDPADAVEHEDHTSVYEAIGAKITIDMVQEDPETGLAFVTWEGAKYELGMDFLSHAMVYNCAGSEDAFNRWWKLYIQRWNYLVPEVPLYANQYFDLYNAKIQNFATTPYWNAADAIIAASVTEGAANSVILGSGTDLSGQFRNASWGKSSAASSDKDIENLVSGYATVQTDKNGAFVWNEYAIAEIPTAVKNEDGTLTYTIKLKDDMVFSDGSKITAKNYIAGILADSTAVGAAAGGTGKNGMNLVGFEAFHAYQGEGDKVYFEGIKLIDEYTFSVTYIADYADYYYVMSYANFAPAPMALYLGENDIVTAESGAVGLSDGFYAKTQQDGADVFVMADVIKSNLKWNSGLPYSGPYVVSDFDASTLTATLTLNPHYPGDTARGKASIETISYVKTASETQAEKFKKGEIDILSGITGAAETEAALALVKEDPTKYAETHYDSAGYGKIGFRADFGPTSMTEVRQAIMYTINRPEFAQTFTGGYGAVVHGPYYTGYSAYKAVENEIRLNQYAYSAESAITVLEEGGWIYNDQGRTYDPGVDAVRYKKLSGYEKTLENLNFKTVDGKYETLRIDGEYYMPLAINWFGTVPNKVTELLLTAWQTNPNATTKIGMHITYTSCNFLSGVYGELMRDEDSGYDGTPKLNAINFVTGFTSAVYDYSRNWTIDPELIAAGYSVCYVKDAADYMENYK